MGQPDLSRRTLYIRRGPFPDKLYPLVWVRYGLSTDGHSTHNRSNHLWKAFRDVSALGSELHQGRDSLCADPLETTSICPFDRVHGFSDNQSPLSRQLYHSGTLFRQLHTRSARDLVIVVCNRVYIISSCALITCTVNVPGISLSTGFFTPISLSLLCSGSFRLRCSPYVPARG